MSVHIGSTTVDDDDIADTLAKGNDTPKKSAVSQERCCKGIGCHSEMMTLCEDRLVPGSSTSRMIMDFDLCQPCMEVALQNWLEMEMENRGFSRQYGLMRLGVYGMANLLSLIRDATDDNSSKIAVAIARGGGTATS